MLQGKTIPVSCGHCDGSGRSGTHECRTCSGRGSCSVIVGWRSSSNMWHSDGEAPVTEERTCPACYGARKVKSYCRFCYGRGYLYDVGGGKLQLVGPNYNNEDVDIDYDYEKRPRFNTDNVKR